MARRPRSLAELLELVKTNPTSLTPAEIRFVRGELRRIRKVQGDIPGGAEIYQRIREESARRRRQVSRSGRDIGPLPPVAAPERRATALASLRSFAETYFPQRFSLAWSPTHLAVLTALERVITQGGRYALAVERGFGKTSLLEVAALWAVLRGLHRFVQLIGSSKGHAVEMLASIRAELEDNERLAEDFPEVCYPIQCLDGIHNRAAGQLCNGVRTRIGITKEELILPTVPGSPASGAIIRITGLTGRIRGRKHKLVRPSLVLLDDPQTEASAKSPTQTDKREQTIDQAVLGLAGPNQQIAVLLTGTVICRDDLMHRYLDPVRHPGWIQQRYKMVLSWPTRMDLWQQYHRLRTDEIRLGGDGSQANEFYRQHREAMDEGAAVSWPERKKPGEISAIQSAMHLYFEMGADAFASEYQNEPVIRDLGAAGQLEVHALAAQVLPLARGLAPLRSERVTAFIDVQHRLLFYAVVAWSEDFTGHVVDYGTYPEQAQRYFTAADAAATLARKAPGAGPEAALLRGLEVMVSRLLGRTVPREDGLPLAVQIVLIDAGDCTDTVLAFCRRLPGPQRPLVLPYKGMGITARSLPMHEYRVRPGERRGLHWILRPLPGHGLRHVLADVNAWKSFIATRLQQAPGDPGALTFFRAEQDPYRDLLLEHCTAEYFVETSGRGRTLREWSLRPGRRENHWWDCLVGAAVGASLLGCALPGADPLPAGRKTKVRWSQVLAQRRQSA